MTGPTTRDLLINSFNAISSWNVMNGRTPYLNASDSHYVGTDSNGQICKEFSFEQLESTLDLVSCTLYCSGRNMYPPSGDVSAVVYLWKGSEWIEAGTISYASYSFEFKTLDVKSILSTIAKINSAKIYFVKQGAPYITLRLDCCYLRVVVGEYISATVTGVSRYKKYSFKVRGLKPE